MASFRSFLSPSFRLDKGTYAAAVASNLELLKRTLLLQASRQVRHTDEQHAAQRGGSRDGRDAKEGSSGSGDSESDTSESEEDSSSSSGSEDGFESGEGSGEAAAS
eukprot:scaffold100169_cov17-Tisochrysis_lutea.AAC.1